MLGAIVGDILGSAYEANPQKTKRFEYFQPYAKFTDDTVMTVAVAHAIESGSSFEAALRRFGREYPQAGYGGQFHRWLRDEARGPYGSWSNGSAMRSSPAGWAARTEEEAVALAEASAAPTHNHPEGIRGAQAVALAVFLARTGHSKPEIARRVSAFTGYNLGRRFSSVRRGYQFQIRCELSVPEALIAFLDSTSFDDAIRNAVALGGDSDTQACIAGAVAEAFYGGVPERTASFALSRLSPWLLEASFPFLDQFCLASSARQVRGRLELVRAQVQDRKSFLTAVLPGISDGLELPFPGPRLSADGESVLPELAAVVSAGWTRLLMDLSAVTVLSDQDRSTLEFVSKSCRVKGGLAASFGLEGLGGPTGFDTRGNALVAIQGARE